MSETEPVSLRDCEQRDGDLLLAWANDPKVRASAFTTRLIADVEHRAWFSRCLADADNCRIFIAEDSTGTAIGQIRFNRRQSGAWEVDYSMAASRRGQGLGSVLLGLGIARLEEIFGPSAIEGRVKAGNLPSRRVFEKLGFRPSEGIETGDLLFNRAARKRLIVVATPHSRNDGLVEQLSAQYTDTDFLRVRSQDELMSIRDLAVTPQWVFFPHWSWMVPQEIYANFRCVIFHMTDLPYGRGGSPLQNLIARGHLQTKISAIRCEQGLDTGDIYLKKDLSLDGTAEEILVRANGVIGSMMAELIAGSPAPTPQTGDVTHFRRRTPEDGNIGQLDELAIVYDYIRMLDAPGYPKAFARTDTLVFEFSEARLGDDGVEAKVKIRISRDAQ